MLVFPGMSMAQINSDLATDGVGPLRVILGLLVVLGVIAGLAYVMRRFNGSKITGKSVVKIIGGVGLSARERVVVLEVAGHWIVTGITANQISSLATFQVPEVSELTNATLDQGMDGGCAEDVGADKASIKDIFSEKEATRFHFRPSIANPANSDDSLKANSQIQDLFKQLFNK